FAGAVGAAQPDDLAPLDVEVDAGESGEAAEKGDGATKTYGCCHYWGNATGGRQAVVSRRRPRKSRRSETLPDSQVTWLVTSRRPKATSSRPDTRLMIVKWRLTHPNKVVSRPKATPASTNGTPRPRL